MCLYTQQLILPRGGALTLAKAKKLAIKTATKPMVCYKRFCGTRRHLVTPYQAYEWNLDKLVKVPKFGLALMGNALRVAEGLHANTHKASCVLHGGRLTLKMVIPKGTKYIMSFNGNQIVALAMRVYKRDERSKGQPAKRGKRSVAKVK